MARHIRVGVPPRKLNFYNLPKYQRRAKKVASFRINQNVISALPDVVERELLSGIFLHQGKANEVISQVAAKTGMNVNDVRAKYEEAFNHAREIALHDPSAVVKQKHERQQKPFNWEQPSKGQLKRFSSDFEKAFNRKFDQAERGQRILRAYARGENVVRIARAEGLSDLTVRALIGKMLASHPEVVEARAKANQAANEAFKHAKEVAYGTKTVGNRAAPNPKASEARRPVLQRKLLRVLKKRGIAQGYSQGMNVREIPSLFNMTQTAVNQNIVSIRKENTSIIGQRKAALLEKGVSKKSPARVERERDKLAAKLRREHRNRWIVERYKQGATNEALVRGYDIAPMSAYLIARGEAKQNPELDLARAKSIKRLRLEQRQFERRARRGKLTIQERIQFEGTRKFKADELIKHVSYDEYSAAAKMVSALSGRVEDYGQTNKRKAYVARIEATKYLLTTQKGMASFGEITNHLLEKGIVKNKGEASHAVGELVDMGAVDRVKPKGLRIRDEWVELPSGVIARQTVEFKSRKQKIPKAPRQKAIREAYKKKAASQTPISRTRAISGSRELKGFVEETSNFIAKKRITQESFDRMFNLYKGRFSDGKYYAPEVIANFLIESRSEQTRVNLPYTTVFDFATWIQGQKWREAEKQGQQ